MNLFDFEKHPFQFKHKPIRLFESFAGIGTQAMALKRLGVEIEHVGISEIDKYAISSYNAIHGDVKNYGDIMKINGKDLPPIDLFTWSFPCTDLSKAGKQKGLTDTRSGLGYQVLRIVSEMAIKPTVLVMENVLDLLSDKFKEGWREMYHEIENMGYTNYVEVLNAKNYGVAQNRDRVFMVSILGDYSYEFPQPFKLEKRLKDYLEPVVDEKYYLSEQFIKTMTTNSSEKYDRADRFNGAVHENIDEAVAWTIQTTPGTRPTDNFIKEPKIAYALSSREFTARGWMEQAPTLKARDYKDPLVVAIPEDTIQGYALAEDGDGVYINRPHQKRGVVQKQMIQTIKTTSDDIEVVVGETQNIIYIENIEIVAVLEDGNEIVRIDGKAYLRNGNNYFRIRKLSPLECWRLMGIDDTDYFKAQQVCSNSQLYKQAGNAIVVDVLVEIFGNLL